MKVGELWLVNYPYNDDPAQSKYRPALIILGEDENGHVKCAKITGSVWRATEEDFIIIDWLGANLTKKSLAELTRIELIDKQEFSRKIGQLTREDLITLYSKLI